MKKKMSQFHGVSYTMIVTAKTSSKTVRAHTIKCICAQDQVQVP